MSNSHGYTTVSIVLSLHFYTTPRFYLTAMKKIKVFFSTAAIQNRVPCSCFYVVQVALERLRVLGEVNCPAFVDVSGQVACSVEQLNRILQTAAEEERHRCTLLLLVCV